MFDKEEKAFLLEVLKRVKAYMFTRKHKELHERVNTKLREEEECQTDT